MTATSAGAANTYGWADTMAFFSTFGGLPAPTTSLASWMSVVRTKFLRAFADDRPNHPFHGARSTPGITRQQRQQVVLSATSMYGMNIWWTWEDMLDYKGTGWNGTVSDIDEVRCEGVVEFSYEEHGLRVCGGKHPNRRNQWNIALPAANHAENHNDFHSLWYEPGELCARIQAGDQANDTQFIVPPPALPTITEFAVTGWFLFFPPIIYFDSLALHS